MAVRKNRIEAQQQNGYEAKDHLRSLKQVMLASPWIVELFDKSGTLVWKNNFADEFWNQLQENAKEDFNIIKALENQNPDLVNQIKNCLAGETLVYIGSDYHVSVGDHFKRQGAVEITLSPVYANDSSISHCLLVIRPVISEYMHTEPDRNTQRETDEDPAEIFLRNISHELRTPLNWIMGFSDIIAAEQDILKIKGYNEHIKRGGKLMLSTIEMLIDMSFIVKNEVSIKKTTFSVNKLLREIARLVEEEIRALNSRLSVRTNTYLNDRSEEHFITSDEVKIKKIFNGLIHNALKFTSVGYIEIGSIDLPEKEIMFYVKDTGIGISADIRDYIFETFARGDQEVFNYATGQGLGLAIVKNYVMILGGKIWLDSEINKGTTFFFSVKDQSAKGISLANEKPNVTGYQPDNSEKRETARYIIAGISS